jgi:3',5'-cyclic AMP phosphodiesterase CpdA
MSSGFAAECGNRRDGTTSSREATILIAQISDLHVQGTGEADFGGVDTAAHLARAVAHLNRLDPAPDVVLATGDLTVDGRPQEYERLRGLFADLKRPLYLIPGNHDDRDNIRAAFPDHAYLPANGEFLHYVVDDHPLRLIGLDTQVPGKIGGAQCPVRLAWLEAQLDFEPERATLIFMHHPPFRTGLPGFDAIGCADGPALAEVVADHDNVVGVLCGHVHRMIQSAWAGTVATVAPSTGFGFPLDLNTGGFASRVLEPPACLLHLWRPEQGLTTHVSYIGDFETV